MISKDGKRRKIELDMSHVFTYEHKVINNSVTEVKYEIGRISFHYENRR